MLKTIAAIGFTFLLAGVSESAENSLSCSMYIASYNDSARVTFALGYLEGVQAALTKEVADIIVPPSDRDHPIWWVLPTGGTTVDVLADRLSSTCRAQHDSDLVKAALSMAYKRDGRPAFGILSDKETGKPGKEHDKWKQFLREATTTCKTYNKSNVLARQALVSGYFVGTEAYRIAMKDPPVVPWMAWPLGIDPSTVRLKLDEDCAQPKNADSTIRDALWVMTAEMSVRQSSPKK
jgi:hypothetical protein